MGKSLKKKALSHFCIASNIDWIQNEG